MSEQQTSAVIQISIDSVQPIKRIRAADSGKVTSLSDSIQQLGLLNPITVRPDYRLIAGLHRLEACKRLGWKSIAAIVVDYAATNDDETAELYAELAEIDENLIRNDLTELHQGIQHARRKVIYEKLHPAAVHGGDRKSESVKNQVENFSTCSYATDAASATGVTERTVRNKTRIGEQLADVAEQLQGTAIEDNQSELLALAKLQESNPDVAAVVIERLVAERDQVDDPESIEAESEELEEIEDDLEDEEPDELDDGLDNPLTEPITPIITAPTPAAKPSGGGRRVSKASKPKKAKKAKIKKIPKPKTVSVKAVVDEIKKQQRIEDRLERIVEISQGNAELNTEVRYPVLYADPPWHYEFAETDNRAIENQYPTMDLDAICALQVSELATPDAILFLWATSPKLSESMKVIESWGFTYKTCAVWDKQKIGMGYYFRQQHELLLVATRGSIPVPPPAARPSSVLQEVRGEHSAKPSRFAEMIEAMYPTLPKIELFCRSPREGWAVWGNQSC